MTTHLDYPLRTSLRVEPLRGDEVGGLIGQERAVRSIVEYLIEHREGRFLISGFPGVGKSSLIRRVVHDLHRHPLRNDRRLVVIELPARTIDNPEAIGKRLVWNLRWEVEEGRIKMGRESRARLLEAYEGVATSAVERGNELSESITATAGVDAPATLGAEASRSTTSTRKGVYVPYDVTTSLLELGQLITGLTQYAEPQARSWWRRWRAVPATVAAPPLVVVIIDRVASWAVLQKLDNLFSAAGVVFLVVVPAEVRAAWLSQSESGHEELAGFQDSYLNCLWDDLPRLLERYVDVEAASPDAQALYPKVIGFLTFASSGIPRTCVKLLIKYKQKDDRGRAVIRFDSRARQTIEFYNRVFSILSTREREILGAYFAHHADADRDRARRCMIASAREIISKGSIPRANPLSTMIELAESLRPPEREHIVATVIQAFLAEGVLIAQGSEYTLSESARAQVAEGRAILGTGILPRIDIEPARASGPAASARRPAGQPHAVQAMTGELCLQCRAHFPLAFTACPSCGIERIETRTGEFRDSDAKTKARLEAALGDRYKVKHLIGRGGMGSVYLATDERLQRDLAIKILAPELSFGEDIRSRFLSEARYAGGLQHPNIAPIFEMGTAHEFAYFAMAYVEGGSLATRIEADGPMRLRDAVALLAPIAGALDYAHQSGIVHRDVKPGNILIDRRNHAYLCDFGIAKATSDATSITASGMIIGTPRFMAPEQAQGKQVTAASDQYSFGVVLYYALTGRYPFDGDTIFAVLHAAMSETPVAISEFLPRPVPELDAVVRRMLEKDPADRFPAMADVQRALLALPNADGALS